MNDDVNRRQLLATVGSGAVVGFAGCGDGNTTNSEASGSDNSTATETGTTEREAIVFDGGDTESLITAIETAAESPESTLTIEPGTYRLEPSNRDLQSFLDGHVELAGLSEVTIEGNDATLVFTDPTLGMLHFYAGDAITLRDLTLDYDPTPFTQAVIKSFSRENRTVVVDIEDGYPSLDHRMFDTEKVWASTHTSNGEFVSGLSADKNPDKDFSSIEQIEDGRFELTIKESSSLLGLESGRRLVIVARAGNHALHFRDVTPTVQNVTLRASIAWAMHFGVCTEPTIENCTIGPHPDSDRLIGSDADGIHCLNSRGAPRIENCDIHHLEDDGIVVATHMASIVEFVDDHTVLVESVPPVTVDEGDSLRALSPPGEVTKNLPRVTEVDYRIKSELNPGRPRTITFERPVTEQLAAGDFLLNEETANHGYVVRNNSIRNTRASLVRLASGHGEFIGNDLSGSSLAAVELECDTAGQGSGWLYDVEIAENTIDRSGLNYINLASKGAPGIHLIHRSSVRNTASPHREIRIHDNEITESGGFGVLVEDTTDITMSNNRVTEVNQLGLQQPLGRSGYGIGLDNVDDGTVSNNTISGSVDFLSTFGWRVQSDRITVSENRLVIDDEPTSATFLTAQPIVLEFSQTVSPDGDSRDLAFLCAELTFVDDQGNTLKAVNMGDDESGVSFGHGVYAREDHGGDIWRWFGGPDGEAFIHTTEDLIAEATAIRLSGSPIEQGISVYASIEGGESTRVELGQEGQHTVTVPLP